jgi:hypothetical protein
MTEDAFPEEFAVPAEEVAAETAASQKSAGAWVDLEVRIEGTNNSTLPYF